MAQVSPFRSANSSVSGVYHKCSKCQAGQQIPLDKQISGSGGLRLCQLCEHRISIGSC